MKDLYTRLKKISKLKDSKTRQRLISLRKIKSKKEKLGKLENELGKLWQRLTEKGATKKNLWFILQNIERKALKTEARKELLKRKDLTSDDIHEMFETADNKFQKEEVWKKFLEMGATIDNLFYFIRFGENSFREKAWKELLNRVQKGLVGNSQARLILSQIIKEVEGLRTRAWKEFKKLDPSRKELLAIIDLPFSYAMPSLVAEVEKLLRKKRREKEPNIKIINKIKEVAEEINKLKKG